MLQALVSLSQVKKRGKEFSDNFKLCIVYFYQKMQKVVNYYWNTENSRRALSFTIHNNYSFQKTLPFLTVLPEKS